MLNPLKNIFNIRKNEVLLAILMAAYFFCIIASYWILKPLKKGLFLEFYDQSGFDILGFHLLASQTEQLAKVLNMVVAFGAMCFFSAASKKFKRHNLTILFLIVLFFGYIFFAFELGQPNTILVWAFYLFGDLFNMLMVAAFFAFLNDSVTPQQAKRLYGVIIFGGVLGGAFGSILVRTWIEILSLGTWVAIAAGISVLIGVLAFWAGKITSKIPQYFKRSDSLLFDKKTDKKTDKKIGFFDGIKMVSRSKYLFSIAIIVGAYELVSSIADFQFSAVIEHYLDGAQIGKHVATVYVIVNIVALFVQIFLTSTLLTRLGIGKTLLILPAALLVGSMGFIIVPVLLVGSFMCIADNGLNYSINQSAKEALYVVANRDEKYSAKAFIDIFIQRCAKTVGVVITFFLSIVVFSGFAGVRALSIASFIFIAAWIVAAIYAGKQFDKKEKYFSNN